MVKIEINGKPFSAETLEEQFMLAAAEAVRQKLGTIRHPTTGEFPTIVVTGNSFATMKIQLEGSPELVELAKRRLAEEDEPKVASGTDPSATSATSATSAASPAAPGVPRAFLSYTFDDQQLAERIATALNNKGIDTWWAGWCISAGDSIRQKIDEGLSGCTHFIVLLTPRSIGKPWVQQEMDAGLVRKLSSGAKFIALRSDLPTSALPMLLQGSLSPEVNADSFDITQLINDIHGISRKPRLGKPPSAVSHASETGTGYSPAATSIAKYFVEQTSLARKLDPQKSIAEVVAATGLSEEDVIDGAHELTGLVSVFHKELLYPEEELFVRFDKFWKPWNPAADALTLATRMVNDSDFPGEPALIAKIFDWEPRRLNAALAYLSQRKLVRDIRSLNTGPWLVGAVQKTDDTRRFVKSRQ